MFSSLTDNWGTSIADNTPKNKDKDIKTFSGFLIKDKNKDQYFFITVFILAHCHD